MFYKILKPYINSTQKKTLKRGEVIYHQGDHPKSLYLVEEGLVGLFHISENGKETFLRVFNKDYIFGHRSYFAGAPYHGTTQALTKTEISIIGKEECERICQEHPELLLEMTKMLAKNLGEAELRLAGLLDKTANARIIESLVYLKLKHPDHVWTRKEIAEFGGSTFETVTRVMGRLDQEDLIRKEGRDFKILDMGKLLDYAKKEA